MQYEDRRATSPSGTFVDDHMLRRAGAIVLAVALAGCSQTMAYSPSSPSYEPVKLSRANL